MVKEGRKGMFYLTTHSTHFIYGTMASVRGKASNHGPMNRLVDSHGTMLDQLSYFLFQPVLHNWCNKGSGMYHYVEKNPLLRYVY